ncbi:hypothetical protein JCM5350_007408 [Sporobolomyces pararoseus]
MPSNCNNTNNSKVTCFTFFRTFLYSFSIGVAIGNLVVCALFIQEVSRRLYGFASLFLLSPASTNFRSGGFARYYEPSVELLAASAILILVLPILHFGIHYRTSYAGILSSISFELIVLFILWCLFLGGVAATTSDLGTAFRNTRFCRQSRICSLGRTIEILSWVEWSSLTLLIFLIAGVGISKGSGKWNRPTGEIVRGQVDGSYRRKGSTATTGTSGEMTQA